MPPPRTVEQLRADAWQAFTKAIDAGKPATATRLAEAARITTGAAWRFLTEWESNRRAARLPVTPPPGPYLTPWTTPSAVTAPAGPFRVLVTGSRDWTHTPTITAALDRLRAEHGGRLVVVHGACPDGADAIADRWAHANGAPVEAHPARWSTGRRAGPDRNARMVATDPAACLAFIRNDSRGATGCARLAERAGIPTARHTTHHTQQLHYPCRHSLWNIQCWGRSDLYNINCSNNRSE